MLVVSQNFFLWKVNVHKIELFLCTRLLLLVCCAEYERQSSSSVDQTLNREHIFIPAHAVKSESWC